MLLRLFFTEFILMAPTAKDCWPSFSKAYPQWEALLNAHNELHNIQGLESTLAQRQKEFKKLADKLSAMVGFHTVNRVNIDVNCYRWQIMQVAPGLKAFLSWLATVSMRTVV